MVYFYCGIPYQIGPVLLSAVKFYVLNSAELCDPKITKPPQRPVYCWKAHVFGFNVIWSDLSTFELLTRFRALNLRKDLIRTCDGQSTKHAADLSRGRSRTMSDVDIDVTEEMPEVRRPPEPVEMKIPQHDL